MIVWLNVPYAQKDAARRLGARWSAAQKKWYVQDVENLGPFMRWIDERLKRPGRLRTPKPSHPGRQVLKGAAITGRDYKDDGIRRDWPPWEDGPDSVAVEFSDEAICDKLRCL